MNAMLNWRRLLLIFLLLVGPAAQGVAPGMSQFIPPPMRLYIPFEAAWNGMLEVLEKNDFEILQQDRAQGSMVSSFREYSSGLLTESHISKIGEQLKLIDGDWLSVRYQYEVYIELIGDRETLLTVYANIEALQREYLGTETWVKIQTIGNLEARLLTQFGQSLFGQNFSLQEPKKGFWDRDPTYLPDPAERIPRTTGPERP
jgi:hypothetical protein